MAQASAEAQAAAAAKPTYYTLCRDTGAEVRVTQDVARLATGIDSEAGEALRALVLVGAFARGEGGIVARDGEPAAAEPGYQLLAVIKRNPEKQRLALEMMAAAWGRLLRARVTIRGFAARDLRTVPATRFWFHTSRGQHITLTGDPSIMGSLPQVDVADLRSHEPMIALCEGLTGLALATLDANAALRHKVERLQRAVLACSDALLLHRGQYPALLGERAECLQRVQASAALRNADSEAVSYLRRPDLWRGDVKTADAASEDPGLGDGLNVHAGAELRAWLESTRSWLAAQYLELEAERIGSDRDLLRYVDHAKSLFTPQDEREHAHALPRLAHIWRPMPPLERLLRCSAALAFGSHVPSCRRRAATLLPLPRALRGSTTDATLAQGLRALARAAIPDGVGQPFASCSFTFE